MFKCGQQEAAEASAGPIRGMQIVLLQENGEEALRQVLRLLGRMALAARESVERIPITSAQLGQRGDGAGMTCMTGREDHRPVRGAKYRVFAGFDSAVCFGGHDTSFRETLD